MLNTTQQQTSTWDKALERGLPAQAVLLVVNVSAQQMQLIRNGRSERSYSISTSKYGIGNTIDSYKTPTGLLEVVERYGDGEPAGRVFFEREATDQIIQASSWNAGTQKDLILTRILRLGGLEDGINRGGQVDTYERYIYFHGSDQEQALGKEPVSHGCIHVGNKAIVDLYDRIKDQITWCWIQPNVRAP